METDVSRALVELQLMTADDQVVELLHATTVENAKAIQESGQMKLDAHGLAYFSTSPEIADDLHATGSDISAIVSVQLPVTDLDISRDWREEGRNRLDLVVSRPKSESFYQVAFVCFEPYSRP